jgi:tetratricopeptide (TPR) repeat protein
VAARPLAGVEWLVLAICSGRAGSSDEALSAARQALILDPTLPEAYYVNGIFRWRAGLRSAAQASFRQAVALDSTYRQPALALVRSRLPSTPPDSLPDAFLNGIREAGLLISRAQPKLEEFIQMDSPPALVKREMLPVPDSLSAGLNEIAMNLPVLVDSQGHIVYHQLPWFSASRLPGPVVGWVLESLPHWQFTPARKLGSPQPAWAAVSLSYKP